MSSPAALLAALLLSCAPASSAADRSQVRFKTGDGFLLTADFIAPKAGFPVLVLLHGLGAGRGEWRAWADALSRRGFGTLALDARGHGDSQGPSYRTFTATEDWLAIDKDLDAAAAFLAGRGIGAGRTAFGGASIGANLALRAMRRHSKAPFALLLSPGMDYQGVRPKADMMELDRPVLLAAAPDDPYALRSSRELAALARDPGARLLVAGSGHGAQMLAGDVNRRFAVELSSWLDGRRRALSPPPASRASRGPTSSRRGSPGPS